MIISNRMIKTNEKTTPRIKNPFSSTSIYWNIVYIKAITSFFHDQTRTNSCSCCPMHLYHYHHQHHHHWEKSHVTLHVHLTFYLLRTSPGTQLGKSYIWLFGISEELKKQNHLNYPSRIDIDTYKEDKGHLSLMNMKWWFSYWLSTMSQNGTR